MASDEDLDAPLMTPAEAAAALGVAPRTLARWASDGRIVAVRTPGGHRRYRRVDVDHLARATSTAAIAVPNVNSS